jgi:hypothetical protein
MRSGMPWFPVHPQPTMSPYSTQVVNKVLTAYPSLQLGGQVTGQRIVPINTDEYVRARGFPFPPMPNPLALNLRAHPLPPVSGAYHARHLG